MRILMLIPEVFYSSRGTPLSAYHRVLDLMALGHEVEVLTYKIGDPPPEPKIRVHRSSGPHFCKNLKQGPSFLKIWFDFLILVKLIYLLIRNDYDVLYAHEEGGFLCAFVSPMFGIPMIYDMHSSLPRQILDWDFSRSELVVRFFGWVEKFILRRAAAAVSIGPGITRAAKEAFPPVRIVTILNRFSIESSCSQQEAERVRHELGLRASHRMILYTGSFVPLQSLDLLIESISLVVSECPDAKFVLVGGTEREIQELGDFSQRIGVRNHLILIPKRPQTEIPAFMAASDVLVSPRQKGINPPGKLFSYLNSGKPVVATRCYVHTQLLDESIAVLAEPNPLGLAGGILKALGEKEHVLRVTESAKRFVQENYGSESRAVAYQQLFQFLGTTSMVTQSSLET